MGMAASQARYLALVARKSNCEYEGQQINQSRLALSNQSADLFNQMMTLEVPSPPSKTDYTYKQYSYKAGGKTYTIDKWNQLADQKYKLNPQVQFKGTIPADKSTYEAHIAKIKEAQKALSDAQKVYDEATATYKTLLSQAANLTYYRDASFNGLTSSSVTEYEDSSTGEKGFTVKQSDTVSRNYIKYDTIANEETKETVKNAIDTLVKYGALEEGYSLDNVYYDSTSGTIAFYDGIENVAKGSSSILYTYHPSYSTPEGEEEKFHGISETDAKIETAKSAMQTAKSTLDNTQAAYDALDMPSYIGNLPLTPLGTLDDDQVADIVQIIKDMKEAGIQTNLTKCFDTLEGTYNNNTYTGGIYTFEQAGKTYYVTYYDLADSAINGTGINQIDNQPKLAYYGAEDIDKTKSRTEKAVLDTDSSGRFTSIRFENDSVVYQLNAETATDEVAYDDAMNQYNYERALYDKKVSDINAKTSIIQRQDQNLELRLKQLDTEQYALSTEIDAVSKVVKDNIEKSFKTFGG